MGFLDALKRWRLAQRGLSSGKKRRVYSENLMVQTLENSIWLKLVLYLAFAVLTALLALRTCEGTVFYTSPLQGALYAFVIAATAIVFFQFSIDKAHRRNSRLLLVFGGLLVHLTLIRAAIHLGTSDIIPGSYLYFIIPYALAPMLHGILLGRGLGSFSAVFVTIIGCLFVPSADITSYMILSLVAGLVSVLLAHDVRRRIQLLQTGIYVGLLIILLSMITGHLSIGPVFGANTIDNLKLLGFGTLSAFCIAVFTALLISGLLPIFEGMFNLTTDISWFELSDLNHKLLRRMQLEAPGTFHHSLVVASLAEAAAEKIGANAPMCRVCAYFHDIGKLAKPHYFIENQYEGGENPHDSLTPTMSALIIIAHVKDGIDLAIKHKLNPRIIDAIQEHHGDSMVAYFYRRAQEQKKIELQKVDRKLENPEDLPKVEEKNFRYPGPRPSTRESAIIALADTVESASRTLTKPTPARIRALIDDLTRAKLHDGQLDNCPLTVNELALVKSSFATTLRSMMHSRISYPKDDSGPPTSTRTQGGRRDDSDDERVIMMPKRA